MENIFSSTTTLNRVILNRVQEEIKVYQQKDSLELKDVTESLSEKLGCRIKGYVEVNKVPGHLRITSLAYDNEMETALLAMGYHIDFSHKI